MAYIFFNGNLVADDAPCICAHDRGLVYGDGFFETILAIDGRPQLLKEHLARLRRSCGEFGIRFPVSLDWGKTVAELLQANLLSQSVAAAKIVITRGPSAPGLSFDTANQPTVLISTRPYQPPPPTKQHSGVVIEVFPEPHVSPLACHKSLNYLYYLMARDYATRRGADECLILDAHQRVLECSAANVLYRKGDVIVKPPIEAGYLKGVIEQQALELLAAAGYQVREEYFTVAQLQRADEVMVTNSLIRVLPVGTIAGHRCGCDRLVARLLRQHRLGLDSP